MLLMSDDEAVIDHIAVHTEAGDIVIENGRYGSKMVINDLCLALSHLHHCVLMLILVTIGSCLNRNG